MKREIDISKYLPPFMTEYKELARVLDTENKEFQGIEDKHWKAIDNRFISTCDEDGIARYEELLSITPLSNDTLEDRKSRVLAKWNRILPYNYEYLRKQLEMLCGIDGYNIDFSRIHEYELVVKIALTSKNAFNDAVKMVDEIVPVNLITTVLLMYNQHETLRPWLHAELKLYTHDELRNMALSVVFTSLIKVYANPGATITISGMDKVYSAKADETTGIAEITVERHGNYAIDTDCPGKYPNNTNTDSLEVLETEYTATKVMLNRGYTSFEISNEYAAGKLLLYWDGEKPDSYCNGYTVDEMINDIPNRIYHGWGNDYELNGETVKGVLFDVPTGATKEYRLSPYVNINGSTYWGPFTYCTETAR